MIVKMGLAVVIMISGVWGGGDVDERWFWWWWW